MTSTLRPAPDSVEALEELLSRPRPPTVDVLRALPGDIMVLGAGGKMGPTLARMARRAATDADGRPDARRVIAVSRFTEAGAAEALQAAGVEPIVADLLDPQAVATLPDAPSVVFMAGQKFGTASAPSLTWAMNTLVPSHCAARYPAARIVAFSTGNVYPLMPVDGPGSREVDAPAPVGEYAASCLGRERMFEYASVHAGTKVAVVRLNYATDLRYGVLVDIATRVRDGQPIDLAMGYVNTIWQGDANAIALECLAHVASPPYVVNVTGPERLSVREVALRMAARLGREPRFVNGEARDALLSDTLRMNADFSAPEVPADTLIEWVAHWVGTDRPLLGKPTKFERRDGRF
ncbi:MAG: NAD(P)-dependent oxidoreductase [Gemmatimonadaceae bacterium]|nr:NAD(P)-dependent oxidoreductase [Gemmatimonadaceae bacterium]